MLSDKQGRSGYFPWVIFSMSHDCLIFKKKKEKENHGQASAPNGAVGLKPWGSHASKLAVCPMPLDPHLWCQACP